MMSKQNVPELRFPEFSGEWEEKKLGEISQNAMYGMNTAATNFDGENVYVRITDIEEQSKKLNTKDFTSPSEINDRYLLNEGDILFARTGASTGKSYLHRYLNQNLKYYFAGFLIKFELKEEFNPNFIYPQTLTQKYDKWVKVMSMRSGQPGINGKEYSLLPIHTTSEEEQEKIGEFFNKLDRLIELEEKKLELLEEQKRGYMQKIFSQELRFKDENGNDYPEWENSHLNKITNINPPEEIKNKEFIYVDLESVEKGRLRNINIIKLADAPSRAKRVLNNQDVLFQTVRPYQKNHLLVINETSNFSMIASTGFAQLRSGSNLVPAFLYHLIHSEKFSLEVAKRCTGTSYPAVLSSDLGKIEVSYPIIEEQKKIGEFFNEIDELTNHIQQKAKQLIQLKNGLLSRLFL